MKKTGTTKWGKIIINVNKANKEFTIIQIKSCPWKIQSTAIPSKWLKYVLNKQYVTDYLQKYKICSSDFITEYRSSFSWWFSVGITQLWWPRRRLASIPFASMRSILCISRRWCLWTFACPVRLWSKTSSFLWVFPMFPCHLWDQVLYQPERLGFVGNDGSLQGTTAMWKRRKINSHSSTLI